MFGPKYVIVPVPSPKGEVRVWFDTAFQVLRLVDDATANRLQAITKSRIALLVGLLAPAAIAIAYLFLFVDQSQEYIVYIVFAVVLMDLTSRAVFTFAERKAIGGLPLQAIPDDTAATLRDAYSRRDLAALQQAAAPLVATAAKPARR